MFNHPAMQKNANNTIRKYLIILSATYSSQRDANLVAWSLSDLMHCSNMEEAITGEANTIDCENLGVHRYGKRVFFEISASKYPSRIHYLMMRRVQPKMMAVRTPFKIVKVTLTLPKNVTRTIQPLVLSPDDVTSSLA